MKDQTKPYVDWFRNSAPYINANRNRTVVLMVSGEAVAHSRFECIVHDIALLNSLGVKLVIVYGARKQIDQLLADEGIDSEVHQDLRATDGQSMLCVQKAVGALRSRIEAALSMGLANSPMHGARLKVCSGNFIVAKPLGICAGVDYGHTGVVRRVDCVAIRQQLDLGGIVLLPPIGYSPTGEVFNLSAEDLATEVAIALGADKLILMCEAPGVLKGGDLVSELNTQEAEQLLADQSQSGEISRHLEAACHACNRGVPRTHLVSYQADGALITELYTRDGAGTLVTVKSYEQLRQAHITDVGGIIELIRPLEKQGVLVRRSRELLEKEIEQYCVIERDGAVIGCAALYPLDDDRTGELACFVVHPDYRAASRGDQLLGHMVKQANQLGLNSLIVLTTQTAHWFLERGFERIDVAALPKGKQALYNLQRNSSVFRLAI